MTIYHEYLCNGKWVVYKTTLCNSDGLWTVTVPKYDAVAIAATERDAMMIAHSIIESHYRA